MNQDKMHFIVVDDSKLDCFIAEKVIQKTGRSASVKSFMIASEALDYINNSPVPGEKTIVLVDIQMPLKTGVEAIVEIKAAIPDARMLVLTSFSEDDTVFSAIKGGALGYLLKDSSPQELIQA